MMDSIKTSVLIPSQLPEFIRDDPNYNNFVDFLQAYYEWMEQSGNTLDISKNILNYQDIDKTTEQFLDYYINEFLQYFPQDSLIDKRTAIKAAKELYKSKGTPASYAFLFKILFNSEFDIFNTKDAVLKASAGTWYIARSLKLATEDDAFLDITKYRIFGEESKSIATIENVIKVGQKVEVFISNIERLFQSGEFVIVIDKNNQPVKNSLGATLRAKIVGQISQIKIDPQNRGLRYRVGDPVIVYGGLNSPSGIGAVATVGSITTGSIQRISVTSGGFGYREDPNTKIIITPRTASGSGATAKVGSINPNPVYRANVGFVSNNSISLSQYVPLSASYAFLQRMPTANINSRLVDALSFQSFTTYPISSLITTNGGGGYDDIPIITAKSIYKTDIETEASLGDLGILAPIQIVNGGTGYRANDRIIFSGGTGYGAYANVTTVSGSGAITSVSYVAGAQALPLGGMGYRDTGLPTLTVSSTNGAAANAQLVVPGTLGNGAQFDPVVDRIGSISTINILNYGEDYTSTPNVSLKVQDIVVANVFIENLPAKGDLIYQGDNINFATYKATVNSVSLLTPYLDPAQSLYNLRVFNYDTIPNPNLQLKIDAKGIGLNMANSAYNANYNSNGVRIYGDASAKATASFLNGLVISQGTYLDNHGHLSSFNVLQDENYNNYTYELTVEKEIAKYRDALLGLVHPSGTKVIGRYAVKSNSAFTLSSTSAFYNGYTLHYHTGYVGSRAEMFADFENPSSNTIQLTYLAGANIANFIFSNNTIELYPNNGPKIESEITNVDYTSNTVSIKDSAWLVYGNVAVISGNTGSNVINIISTTDSYNIINNGIYTDPAYPLKDIVFVGDVIKFANNDVNTVRRVDYINGRITLANNLTSNSNSLMSVLKIISTTNVRIWGPVGTIYHPELQFGPELTTEDNITLTTELDEIILLG